MIIPRLTKLKSSDDASVKPMEGDELARVISKTHPDVKYIDDDEKLVQSLISEAKKGEAIIFLGSHGFREMIEETIEKLA